MEIEVWSRKEGAEVSTVHPTAKLGKGVYVGEGVWIGADVTVGAYTTIYGEVILHERVSVGEHVYIGPRAAIGEDVHVGHSTRINGWATLQRGASIGDSVCIGHGATIGEGCVIPTTADHLVLGPGGSRDAYLTITRFPEPRFSTGCRSLGREAFIAAVKERHTFRALDMANSLPVNAQSLRWYRWAVEVADSWLKSREGR